MIDNLINEIEVAIQSVLDAEQLSQLRKVLDYTFRNITVSPKATTLSQSNSCLTINSLVN